MLLSLALLALGCGSTDTPPAMPPPPVVFRFTPHAEDWRTGPVGSGNNRCELYVYAWEPPGPCRVQVNHCQLDDDGQTLCMSLADERSIACGAQENVCGQVAQCDCPTGAPPPFPEAPGTIHLVSGDRSTTIRSPDGRCTAHTSGLPGNADQQGPPPRPCILSLRECDAAGACTERIQMFSCGVRGEICGRPIRCDCPSPRSGEPVPAPVPGLHLML